MILESIKPTVKTKTKPKKMCPDLGIVTFGAISSRFLTAVNIMTVVMLIWAL